MRQRAQDTIHPRGRRCPSSEYGRVFLRRRALPAGRLVSWIASPPLGSGSWTLKPGFVFGFSRGISGESDWAYIWSAGFRSRYEHTVGSFTLALGNALIFAGNENIGGGQAENFGTFRTGLGARHPIGFHVFSLPVDLEGFFIHHHFIPSAEFDRFREKPLDVKNQFEFGTSIGSSKDWQLLFRRNPRAGVAYRFGDGLSGVRFTVGFPF